VNDERREELAALRALELLQGPELAELEAEIGRDPVFGRRVEELRAAAAAIAYAAPAAEPPAALRERILADVDVGRRARPVAFFPILLPWAAAACLALAAAWSGRLYWSARSEAALLRDQQRLAGLELRSTRNQLEAERIVSRQQLAETRLQLAEVDRQLADSGRQLADLTRKIRSEGSLAQFKIAVLASMLGNSPQALAVAVWDPAKQEGVLSVSKLPAAARDRDYQLWVIDPQYPAPVSGGVFTVDAARGDARVNFRAERPVKSIAKFAVSVERKGGVPAPEGPIVLISQ